MSRRPPFLKWSEISHQYLQFPQSHKCGLTSQSSTRSTLRLPQPGTSNRLLGDRVRRLARFIMMLGEVSTQLRA